MTDPKTDLERAALLPCPFCGATDIHDVGGGAIWHVKCGFGDCPISHIGIRVEQWNRRAPVWTEPEPQLHVGCGITLNHERYFPPVSPGDAGQQKAAAQADDSNGVTERDRAFLGQANKPDTTDTTDQSVESTPLPASAAPPAGEPAGAALPTTADLVGLLEGLRDDLSLRGLLAQGLTDCIAALKSGDVVLVPREPTVDMIVAATVAEVFRNGPYVAADGLETNAITAANVDRVYRAMLDAKERP